MQEHSHPARCPDCDGDSPVFLGSLPDVVRFAGKRLPAPLYGGALFQCGRCRLKFRHPLLDTKTYEDLYDNGLVASWTPTLRTDQRIVREFLCEKLRGGRVLDYGCYTGLFLSSLPAAFSKFGVEVNKLAAAKAERDANARVWRELEEMDDDQQFDGVVCMDVVEHFPSPLLLVRELMRKLRPGGVLLMTTGDAESALWNRLGSRWWYCGFGEHVAFISRGWLVHNLATLGADLEQCEPFNYKSEGRALRVARWGAFMGALVLSGLRSLMSGAVVANDHRKVAKALPGIGLTRDHLFIVLRKR